MCDARGIGGFGRSGQRSECQSAEKLDFGGEAVGVSDVIVGGSRLRASGAPGGAIVLIGYLHRAPARRNGRPGALADPGGRGVRGVASDLAAVIRIDAIWLSTVPLDMRAGTDTALARVVTVFGAARPHHAYLFANRRSNRMKVLVHDGIGIWLCARRLNRGRFIWANVCSGLQVPLTSQQLDTLILGLPWQRVADAISLV